MLSRRQLIARGAGLAALPLLARVALALEPGAAPLYKVIVDRRFAASRAFGRAAARAGVAVHTMSGDVTDVWYHDLGPTWRVQPLPVAGLTAEGAIFCLERLAWDAGMRVAFRGVHTLAGSGRVAHELEGSQPVLERVQQVQPFTRDWAEELSGITALCTAPGSASRARLSLTSVATAEEDAWTRVPLVSWVIAPHHRTTVRVPL